jgi:transcriptional regulator GlxA family with amidase domain
VSQQLPGRPGAASSARRLARIVDHVVSVVVLDGVLPIDLGVPTQIFGPRADTDYALTVCGPRSTVRTSYGLDVHVAAGLDTVRDAHTVLVPGYEDFLRDPPDIVLDTLRCAARRGARVVSICTGAFALGAAGLLQGRRATTHWAEIPKLAARFSNVTVEPDSLYVQDGNIFTSAGVTAAIDLCLHLVTLDLGSGVANGIARNIVAARRRDFGQAAFVDRVLPDPGDGALAETRQRALERLDEALTIEDLARHAQMSVRTLTRAWRTEAGMSPRQWLLRGRLDAAREMLERTDLSIERIAAVCGLGSATSFRARFRDVIGTTPTSYRRAFGSFGQINGAKRHA